MVITTRICIQLQQSNNQQLLVHIVIWSLKLSGLASVVVTRNCVYCFPLDSSDTNFTEFTQLIILQALLFFYVISLHINHTHNS